MNIKKTILNIVMLSLLLMILSVFTTAFFIDQEFRQYNYVTQQPCYNSSNGERQALVQRVDSNYGSNGAGLEIYLYEKAGIGLYDKNCFYYFYTDNPQITYAPNGKPNNTDYPVNYGCMGYSGGGVGITQIVSFWDFNSWTPAGANYSTGIGDYIAIAPATNKLGVLECGGTGWTLSVDANHSGLGYIDATTYTTYYSSYINETEKSVSQISTFDIAFATYVFSIPPTNDTIIVVTVKNESGATIENAHISIDSGNLGSGFTNESGVIKFIGDNLSGSRMFEVTRTGYSLQGLATYINPEQTNNITFTLIPFTSLTGVNVTIKEVGVGNLLSNIKVRVKSDEFLDYKVTNLTGNLFIETPQGYFSILATDNRSLDENEYMPQSTNVEVPPNTIIQKLMYMDRIPSVPIKLNVTDNLGNNIYGVKVDAQFIIPDESTIKYTNQSGLVIFNFPDPEDDWTFVFSLAGYQTKISSFDTGNYWQNIQMTPITTDDTELYVFVKNQSNDKEIYDAYVSLDTGQTGYTNPYGWIKIVNDSMAGTRTATIMKGGYETEVDTIYTPLHITTNKTILLTPTISVTTLRLNITREDNGNPIENYYATLNGQGLVNEVRLTSSEGIATFTDIPSGNYELRLDRPLWRSYEYSISIPDETTTQINYEASQNEITMIYSYYTIPSHSDNNINVTPFTTFEVHMNITDENVDLTRCIMYPFYDTQPTYYTETDYNILAGELICSYMYTTTDVTHKIRVWAIDEETYLGGTWLNNPMYLDFNITIGDEVSGAIIFEEHFDYSYDISENGWGLAGSGSALSPHNNELLMTGEAPVHFVYHELNNNDAESFYCEWNQRNQLGNSNFVFFNIDELLADPYQTDESFVSHTTAHIYWYPPMKTIPDEYDYTVDSYGRYSYFNLGNYSFPYLTPDDINRETSSVRFYPVLTDLVLETHNVDNNRVLSEWDRGQEYLYTIYYNVSTKTYSFYQDGNGLLTNFPIHNFMEHQTPNAIGFYLSETTDSYQVNIDDIKCVYGFPDYITKETAEHGWNEDGTFDDSKCNPNERQSLCALRLGWNWTSGLAISWIFSNIIIVAVIIVCVILFAPLLIRRRK